MRLKASVPRDTLKMRSGREEEALQTKGVLHSAHAQKSFRDLVDCNLEQLGPLTTYIKQNAFLRKGCKEELNKMTGWGALLLPTDLRICWARIG